MNPATPRSPPQSQAMTWPCWRLILLLMATCFLAHFNRVSMPVAGDLQIMKQYDISKTAMGFVYSSFLFTYTLMMIPGGWFIDRKGPRRALLMVGLGSAIFVILTGCVGLVAASAALAFPALLAVRSAMGFVSAPLHPAAARAVSLGIPVFQRSAANGLVTGAALVGIASAYVAFFFLIKWLEGWTAAFICMGLLTAVVAWLWGRYADYDESPAVQQLWRNESESQIAASAQRKIAAGNIGSLIRRNKNVLLLAASYAAVGYFQYLFFYWIPHYFSKILQFGETASQFSAAIPPLAMAVGMFSGGWLSDRILSIFGWRAARPGLIGLAMLVSAGLLLIGIFVAESPFWVVTWLSLALGVLGMSEGPFWVTAVEVGGHRGGFSAGIFNTGGNAGGILAPIITPWVSEGLGYGWPVGIAISSFVCLLGALAWFWIDEPDSVDLVAHVPPPPQPEVHEATPISVNHTNQELNFLPNPA